MSDEHEKRGELRRLMADASPTEWRVVEVPRVPNLALIAAAVNTLPGMLDALDAKDAELRAAVERGKAEERTNHVCPAALEDGDPECPYSGGACRVHTLRDAGKAEGVREGEKKERDKVVDYLLLQQTMPDRLHPSAYAYAIRRGDHVASAPAAGAEVCGNCGGDKMVCANCKTNAGCSCMPLTPNVPCPDCGGTGRRAT